MNPIENRETSLAILKDEVASHRRQCGYYLIKIIDIRSLRRSHSDEETLVETVMPMLSDRPWPVDRDWPQSGYWRELECERAVARAEVVEALVGGAAFGHSIDTIPPALAAMYFDRFDALFEDPKIYYTRVGFGDPEYVFSTGVAVFSPTHAGVLCVVEND
ncbi:MAG TPA: hypothetical protein VHC70_02680 [Phycisphaerales bacterium]|nr:hypothetical protein [Phycisphaerales bacterium]